MIDLQSLGWDDFFQNQLNPQELGQYCVGRVTSEHRTEFCVLTAEGEKRATLSGKLRFHSAANLQPVVGDWVCLKPSFDRFIITRCLHRKTELARKSAGAVASRQIIASNVDICFVVTSLAVELNWRKLDRYITVARSSGAAPVLIFTKPDLCQANLNPTEEIEKHCNTIPWCIVNALTQNGIEGIRDHIRHGSTVVLMGSSGVGKSTLTNALLGTHQLKTQAVRDSDSKGRHTTTGRHLFILPSDGVIIDTPGLRGLQVWEAQDAIATTFSEVESILGNCYFSNCSHSNEPGCAVLAALAEGSLDQDRWKNFKKLERDNQYLEMRHNKKKLGEERKKWKALARANRQAKPRAF